MENDKTLDYVENSDIRDGDQQKISFKEVPASPPQKP